MGFLCFCFVFCFLTSKKCKYYSKSLHLFQFYINMYIYELSHTRTIIPHSDSVRYMRTYKLFSTSFKDILTKKLRSVIFRPCQLLTTFFILYIYINIQLFLEYSESPLCSSKPITLSTKSCKTIQNTLELDDHTFTANSKLCSY